MSSTMEIKQQNVDRIREALRIEGCGTKAEISKATGLSIATCNNLLNEMLEDNEILFADQAESQGGRRANRFVYNKNYRHVLAVYMKSVNNVRMVGYVIADAFGDTIESEVLHPDWIDCDYLLGVLTDLLSRDSLIKTVAVAIPGNVYQGVIERCDLRSLENKNLQAMLEERLKVSVLIENDMNFIAYGTAQSYAKSQHYSLVAVDFPANDPVGAGIVIDGKIYKGFSLFAGELSYALQECGIPRSLQAIIGMDKSSLVQMVIKTLVMIICMLDPDSIVLMCEELTDDDVVAVVDYIKKSVGANHIPEIVLSREFFETCNTGMICASLNSLKYQFQLTL